MKVGYIRLSKHEQNEALQRDALQEAGCEKYFSDKITGLTFERKGLEDLLAFVRSGDTVIVWKLDRLGRSLKDLIETLNLLKSRGVDFISLTESIDTTTPGGKLIFHLMGHWLNLNVTSFVRGPTQGWLLREHEGVSGAGREEILMEKLPLPGICIKTRITRWLRFAPCLASLARPSSGMSKGRSHQSNSKSTTSLMALPHLPCSTMGSLVRKEKQNTHYPPEGAFCLHSLPFSLPGFQVTEVVSSPEKLVVWASSQAQHSACPACQQLSSRVHSYYTRSLADLPSSGRRVQLVLRVRRFRCRNPECQQQTFAERLPALPVSARQTSRLGIILESLAVVLSGEAGSRLALQLSIAVSTDTLLRRAKKPSPHQAPPLRVLGADDFAFRRGHTYGTILVD